MLRKIQRCFQRDRVLYSRHAKVEMETEEFGEIHEHEVYEAIVNGEIIENYPDAEPYPCILVYGRTDEDRPIHMVCAYSKDDDLTIVVTVYQPDVKLWSDYRRQRK